MISVVKDHPVFTTEILIVDDFVQKSNCVEELPAECDQRPQILHTQIGRRTLCQHNFKHNRYCAA